MEEKNNQKKLIEILRRPEYWGYTAWWISWNFYSWFISFFKWDYSLRSLSHKLSTCFFCCCCYVIIFGSNSNTWYQEVLLISVLYYILLKVRAGLHYLHFAKQQYKNNHHCAKLHSFCSSMSMAMTGHEHDITLYMRQRMNFQLSTEKDFLIILLFYVCLACVHKETFVTQSLR